MRHDFLVLDELGNLRFAQSGGQMLFHLVSKHYEQTSTIATTNLAFREWPTVFCVAKAPPPVMRSATPMAPRIAFKPH